MCYRQRMPRFEKPILPLVAALLVCAVAQSEPLNLADIYVIDGDTIAAVGDHASSTADQV